jgi:hypothetical protein
MSLHIHRRLTKLCLLMLSLGIFPACGNPYGPILWLQLSAVPREALHITITASQDRRSGSQTFIRDSTNHYILDRRMMGMMPPPPLADSSEVDLAVTLPVGTEGPVHFRAVSDMPPAQGGMPGMPPPPPTYLSDVCGDITVSAGAVLTVPAMMLSPPQCQ